MTPPGATVRLQFNREFTLVDALDVVDYYADLGISHFYASPLTTARTGSLHGYDVVDCAAVDPVLGGIDALRALAARLRARGMGLILDIVPNHMAVSDQNRWWRDVLEFGPHSRYADYFDIDWNSDDDTLHGKVLVPVLARPIDEAIAAGEIKLSFDSHGRRWSIEAASEHFPVSTRSRARVRHGLTDDVDSNATPHALDSDAILRRFDNASAEGRSELLALLAEQHYRLAFWRSAATDINYRRFFDISELIGLRVELAHVFDDVHMLALDLFAEGLIDGVRVDHIDGLADPRAYCKRLRASLDARATARPIELERAAYIVVEKILADGERLPTEWPVHGTTGYDFMAQSGSLLHDARGADALTQLWHTTSGRAFDFDSETRIGRKLVATTGFEGDVRTFATRALAAVGEATLSITSAIDATVALLQAFDVYRTYGDDRGLSASDRALLRSAATHASENLDESTRQTLDAIVRVLESPRSESQRGLLVRFQQLTPPIAAKAVEDTAFYRYGRSISRNEVGSDPAVLAISTSQFHTYTIDRGSRWPHAMLATATHDHKRGEDARARLAVLSELPDAWRASVAQWRALNARADAHPHAGDELTLYQSLVGAWPPTLRADDEDGVSTLADRVAKWQTKALREAKLSSSWIEPNADYEDTCERFLRSILRNAAFVASLSQFVDSIAPAGALNGLTQALVRIASPGVPDLYQGTEFWDHSLVDPDNRSPVDYALRRTAIGAEIDIRELAHNWRDGRIKQHVIRCALAARKADAALFANGAYRGLELSPSNAESDFIAFERSLDGRRAIAIAPLHGAESVDTELRRAPTAARVDIGRAAWRECFTQRALTTDGPLDLAELLADFPLALLVAQ